MKNSGDSLTKPDGDDESTLHWAQVEAEIDLYNKVAVVSGKMIDPLETSPLGFWKENAASFPNLARVSRLVYQIQASSVASERFFSATGLICSARRSSLTSGTTKLLVNEKYYLSRHGSLFKK
jgi:hAT family C-terminal dimerisation region